MVRAMLEDHGRHVQQLDAKRIVGTQLAGRRLHILKGFHKRLTILRDQSVSMTSASSATTVFVETEEASFVPDSLFASTEVEAAASVDAAAVVASPRSPSGGRSTRAFFPSAAVATLHFPRRRPCRRLFGETV